MRRHGEDRTGCPPVEEARELARSIATRELKYESKYRGSSSIPPSARATVSAVEEHRRPIACDSGDVVPLGGSTPHGFSKSAYHSGGSPRGRP